jgi:ubiquinone biosynthesis protein UbiJ
LAENVAEFLLEERRVLVRPSVVEDFGDDVAACATTSSAAPSASPNWNSNWRSAAPLPVPASPEPKSEH